MMHQGVFSPGHNCWQVQNASKAAVIVDAADYFAVARTAMMAAEKCIMLIGWDFDARTRISGECEDGAPDTIGEFILWLVDRRPELNVYLLRWDVGAFKSLFRGVTPVIVARWVLHRRIHVKLDSMHPKGASHHQKILVVDDCLAFCGGIDMTLRRWDRRDHLDDDPERVTPVGKPYRPWHDATMALEGPIAGALGRLARDRWEHAGGKPVPAVNRNGSCWPKDLKAHFENVDIAIARTQPDYADLKEITEIEKLAIDMIARAKHFIYAESQYFASRRIAEAIGQRLAEPDGPEIILINPEEADGWLEQVAMDTARARLYEALRQKSPSGKFRIYHPFTIKGAPIYVHAKIMIVDDDMLRVGSSNMNNRSLRLDTECDLAIAAAGDTRNVVSGTIVGIRNGLLAEHLGVSPETVASAIEETGSLIATIERLRGSGRSLQPYETPNLGDVEKFLADNEVLDPEGPDEMFEPLTSRGLFRHWREGLFHAKPR